MQITIVIPDKFNIYQVYYLLITYCLFHLVSAVRLDYIWFKYSSSILKIRYFVVKSCNRENFELSVQQGVWATQRSNEAKLNEAFDSVENVILIFSVNRTRHFQVGSRFTPQQSCANRTTDRYEFDLYKYSHWYFSFPCKNFLS